MLKNIYNLLLNTFKFNFFITSEQKISKEILIKSSGKRKSMSKPVLLVPLTDDTGTMKIVFQFSKRILETEDLDLKYFFVHTNIDKRKEYNSALGGLFYRLNSWSYFSILRLRKVYGIKQDEVIMSNLLSKVEGNSNGPLLKSKNSLLEFEVFGLNIGELIYDTYLRFRSKPTLDLSDPDLYEIKNYSIELTKQWDFFFTRNKISILLMPYMSYIHWGIPGKVALRHKVQVLTFGSYLYFLQKVNPSYPYHTKNLLLYPKLFSDLEGQELYKASAKKILEDRLKGIIDSGTSYMKSSAFASLPEHAFVKPVDKKWAVIFLHCFFDSPHIYGDGLFPDFFDWLNHLLDVASKNPDISYIIKPHPNGLPENKEVIESFIQKYSSYKNLIFIDAKISNKDIILNRPDAIFTYYGTVAHEFAYFEIPAITCGKNPHSSYNFVYHADSLDELNTYLNTVGNFGLPENYKKDDIFEFFFMHYMYYSPELNKSNFDLIKDFENGNVNILGNEQYKSLIYGN